MSLINFLNSKLKPTVLCDTVCEDGFSASNLIADGDEAARGFLAFSVTKPPIEIIFEFPKAIDLKVIKLWNCVGSLRSTSFEIHGKYDGIWDRVANVRDLDKGVDSVTFCYQSDYNSRSSSGNKTELKTEKVFFFKTAHKMLNNTNSVKIVIKGTHKCPPVLKKIQIWGLPSRSLEKADRELIKTIWKEIMHPYEQTNQQNNMVRRSPSLAPELNENSKLRIPEEFLDAITWELMTFPTVLPSGKVVDRSTIDKHSAEEAKWGRSPSDPFTGLEFNMHRQAILNVALKARIEKFLMENSDHFKTVPRSLGSSRMRRKNRHASQFVSVYQSLYNSAAGTYSSLTSYSKTSSLPLSPSTYTLPAKRAKLNSSLSTITTASTYCGDKPMITSTATQTSATATASYAATASSMSSTCMLSTTDIACHQNEDLEKTIQNVLKKMNRFTQPLVATEPHSCINCDSEHFAYKIETCNHLVCRDCLVQLTKAEMCTCKTSFRNMDVQRYHKL